MLESCAMKNRRQIKAKATSQTKPYCFVSYSMGESTSNLLVMLVWAAFHLDYDIRLTPSALKSGSSQLRQIESLMANCAFAVVCLDGLRPNVVHEYGYLRGQNRPVILLKKEQATVDVLTILGPAVTPGLNLSNPVLDIDVHLSNLKDIYHATWFPDDAPKSVKTLFEEYNKLRREFDDLKELKEPHLW